MRKAWIYLPVMVLIACGGKDQKAENPEPAAAPPLAKSQNSDAFNASFRQLLDNYFNLKDALVRSKDSSKTTPAVIDPAVNTAAAALITTADSLKLKELKADEAIVSTAQSYAQGIASEAKALTGEPNLETKRKSFQMISGQLYDLIRTVRYDREIFYHDYCPMAFNNEGAEWLSRSPDIKNPYFGPKMLTCGEVKDSLDFTVKK